MKNDGTGTPTEGKIKGPVIASWVEFYGWTRLAEIGVKKAETTAYLLARCPGLTVFAVDIWDEYVSGAARKLVPKARADAWERKTRERLAPFGDRAVILKARSTLASLVIEDASLDCAFIDANHTEDEVLADIAAWRPKVRSGGMLAGHDLHVHAVRQAVEKSFPPRSWHEFPAHVWAFLVP